MRKILYFILIIAILSLAACGRNRDTNNEPPQEENFTNNIIGGLQFTPGTHSLTISAPLMREQLFRQAAESLREKLAAQGVDLHVEIIYYTFDETESHYNLMLSKQTAGQGADIFAWDFFPIYFYQFVQNDFLADINEILNLLPDKQIFHTNILEAFEFNGKLFMLPLQFGLEYISINENVPLEFAERFSQLEQATPNDLMNIYLDLIKTYPEWEEFAFIHGMDAYSFFATELNNGVDFINKTVNIDSLFDMLEGIRLSFSNNDRSNSVFTVDTSGISLTDKNGRLVQRSFTGSNISISNSTDKNLALAYLTELLFFISRQDSQYYTPILRQDFNETPENPTTYSMITSIMPYSVYTSILGYATAFDAFMAGEIHFAETLAYMEQDIFNWLNNKQLIENYTPETIEQLDLPVRTLKILTGNNSAAVVEQAAAAMNEAWRASGKPYTFQVEIDSYLWHDNDIIDARNTRLQTELMAGQGPDLFKIDRRQDIYALINSGYIADINALMTNLDDFFEQPLYAYEISGGLYYLPLNFGYDFVSINANLPQPIIERFSQYSYISIPQIIEIYLELIDNYGDEFGHLLPAVTTSFMGSIDMMESVMGEFVDFNSRAAYLTDSQFISFLEKLARIENIAGERNPFQSAAIGIAFDSFLRDIAQEYVFIVSGSGLSSANAFFIPIEERFTNYIPLVNSHGKLLAPDVRWSQTIWSSYAITNTGDSELAWEFLQYLIAAYTEPVGRAAGNFGEYAGSNNLASPIHRSLFCEHSRRAFNRLFGLINGEQMILAQGDMRYVFVGTDNEEERNRQIENAIDKIAELNEMPMAMINPMIPRRLYEDNFELFKLGLITPQDFAQRLQNSVSLWLIE